VDQAEVTGQQQTIDAARQIGVEIVPAPVSSTSASDLSPFDHAVDGAISDGAQAFVVSPPVGGQAGWSRIAVHLKDLHLASSAGENQYPELGGLAAYGANLVATCRRTGYFVDRIQKGTSPADLPIEYPTVFDFAINRSTAEAIGVTIPPEVALQVTEWVP
jgi:putative ABC transport system substrate-binding protein